MAKDKIIDKYNFVHCNDCSGHIPITVGVCETIIFIKQSNKLKTDEDYEEAHMKLVNKRLRRDKLERIING